MVRKIIRGETCTFACGQHLTIEQARLIAGNVDELAKMTNDNTEIMNCLKPFAKKHNIALSKWRKYIRKAIADDKSSEGSHQASKQIVVGDRIIRAAGGAVELPPVEAR